MRPQDIAKLKNAACNESEAVVAWWVGALNDAFLATLNAGETNSFMTVMRSVGAVDSVRIHAFDERLVVFALTLYEGLMTKNHRSRIFAGSLAACPLFVEAWDASNMSDDKFDWPRADMCFRDREVAVFVGDEEREEKVWPVVEPAYAS